MNTTHPHPHFDKMAGICTRCALRLRRAAETSQYRSFSSSEARRSKGALPTFRPSSNAELDDTLSSFRYKHFLPAALSKPEQRLIFKHRNRDFLAENPRTVTLGDEEIELEWIDRKKEIPNRVRLLHKAVRFMAQGEKTDWNNLPALLAGLHKAKRTPTDRQLAKMVRLATNNGKFGTILQCLHQAHNTGLTMKKDDVLNAVIWGLREIAQVGQWSEESTSKAIRDANEVAMQLEDTDHGTGTLVPPKDPRRRPEVLSVFLELAAVYAYRYQDGKDVDGKVKAYAERLLSNIENAERVSTILS